MTPRPRISPAVGCGQVVELVLGREFGVDDRRPFARRAREQLGQAMIALRADHHVDRRRAAQDLPALGLGDAAGDDDRASRGPRPLRARLQVAHPAELGIDLLGGLLADMAGVEDDEVGLLHVAGLGV